MKLDLTYEELLAEVTRLRTIYEYDGAIGATERGMLLQVIRMAPTIDEVSDPAIVRHFASFASRAAKRCLAYGDIVSGGFIHLECAMCGMKSVVRCGYSYAAAEWQTAPCGHGARARFTWTHKETSL